MARVDLRFYGRFVFAQPSRGRELAKHLDVLAVDMQFNRDLHAGRHHFLMTAPRSSVSVPGTRQPDFKVLSADSASRAEHHVWDLDGHEIWSDLDSGFEWEDKSRFADLAELTPGGATFDQGVLDLTKNGPVNAKVRIGGGRGTAEQLAPETFDLVPLKARQGKAAMEARPLADLVRIRVDVPDDKPMFLLKMKPKAGGATSSIAIAAKRDETTVVSFTNLCSMPHSEYDEEFAGLYEVLTAPPVARDRLIPRERPKEGDAANCNLLAYIRYFLTGGD